MTFLESENVKKWMILGVAVLLTGCSCKPAYETMGVISPEGEPPVKQQIYLDIPDDAVAAVSDGEGTLYECGAYDLSMNTVASGDLDATVQNATGYRAKELEILETEQEGYRRYQAVFASAGAQGMKIGRICILDDGAYHYVVVTSAPEEKIRTVQEAWNALFSSVRLMPQDVELNTGS